jgi:folate-dependent phosphoribosylglycinamide formyltransferase PurN
MRLAILTTETHHHAHFVRAVVSRFPVARVFCETTVLKAQFETAHPFEATRDEDECRAWFGGAAAGLADFAAVERVCSLNDPGAVASLRALAPEVVLVFGTGRLAPAVLAVQPRLMLNFHGGDPEEYRGLDTHLWAIYHRDFAGLVTTLHRMTPEIDDGDIVLQARVSLHRGMALHELRRANTETCVALALKALSTIEAQGDLPDRAQRSHGRYYSFMPTPLKELCRKRFAAYTAVLTETGTAA